MASGCAREIGSDESAPPDESRATLAVATPPAESDQVFQTNLYSERDADIYNRLLVEENVGVGMPITAIHVELGDRVAKGQLLATLEDSDARLDVEAAEPEVEIAGATLHRVQELAKTGAVSTAELEDAVYQDKTARAALEKAKLNLSRTRIVAPFAGVISRRYVRVGDVVDDKTPLFRVTALAPLRARLLVPEERVAEFRRGAAVTLTASDGTSGTARVILVSPTTDPGAGTREVIVELTEVGTFRPGRAVAAELAAPATPETGEVAGTAADAGNATETRAGGE
jgi:RND family efflux transporter MFP subunit